MIALRHLLLIRALWNSNITITGESQYKLEFISMQSIGDICLPPNNSHNVDLPMRGTLRSPNSGITCVRWERIQEQPKLPRSNGIKTYSYFTSCWEQTKYVSNAGKLSYSTNMEAAGIYIIRSGVRSEVQFQRNPQTYHRLLHMWLVRYLCIRKCNIASIHTNTAFTYALFYSYRFCTPPESVASEIIRGNASPKTG